MPKRKRPNQAFEPKKKKKLGKKKLYAKNQVPIQLESKRLYLNEQNLRDDEMVQGKITTSRNLSLADILEQMNHYNDRVLREALRQLKELVKSHSDVMIQRHMRVISERILKSIQRSSNETMKVLLKVIEEILSSCPEIVMRNYINMYVAHVCSAMSHVYADLRIFGCEMMLLLLQYFSRLCCQEASSILQSAENIFLMTKLGYATQGKNFKKLRLLVLKVLDRMLIALIQNNSLKIDHEKEIIHIHTHKNEKVASTWNGDIHNEMRKLQYRNQSRVRTLYQRFVTDQRNEISLQQKIEEMINPNQMERLESAAYLLEKEEHIKIFIYRLYPTLKLIWMEQVNKDSDSLKDVEQMENVYLVLSIFYNLLYSLERVGDVCVVNSTLEDFLPHLLRKIPLSSTVRSSLMGIQAINSLLTGILSFYHPESHQIWETEYLERFWSFVFETKFDSKDFGMILGTINRLLSRYVGSRKTTELIWKKVEHLIIKSEPVTSEQSTLLLEFLNAVKFPVEIDETCSLVTIAKYLAKGLSSLQPEHSKQANLIFLILSKVNLSIHEWETELLPFFFNDGQPGAFIHLADKTSVINFLFTLESFSSELVKCISQTCAHLDEEEVSHIVEILRLKKDCISQRSHISFLFTLCCKIWKSDVVISSCLISIKLLNERDMVTTFVGNMLTRKNLHWTIVFQLLKVLDCVGIESLNVADQLMVVLPHFFPEKLLQRNSNWVEETIQKCLESKEGYSHLIKFMQVAEFQPILVKIGKKTIDEYVSTWESHLDVDQSAMAMAIEMIDWKHEGP